MPMLVYATGLVSPRVEGMTNAFFADHIVAAEAEALTVNRGSVLWSRLWARGGSILGYPGDLRPLYMQDAPTARELAQAMTLQASKVFFTLRTTNWRTDRTEITEWIRATWIDLELPGEPPADIYLRSGWKQREMRRAWGPTLRASPFVRLHHTRGMTTAAGHLLALPRKDFS